MTPPATLKTTVRNIAKLAGENRETFNHMIMGEFGKCIGSGAFRMVFASKDWVIKVRRHEMREDASFSMQEIEPSNREEIAGFRKLTRNWKVLSQFVMTPFYMKLANGHDVILMRKVDYVIGQRAYSTKWCNKNPLLEQMVSLLTECFRDAHEENLGVLNGRVYMIDVNRPNLYRNATSDKKGTETQAAKLLTRAARLAA